MIFGRTKRPPRLVEYAIEAARDLGYDGEIDYDAAERALVVSGLGRVPLGPFIDRSHGLTEAQQRPKMRAAITKAMRAQPVELPERYRPLDAELRRAMERALVRLRIHPGAPTVLQEIGRIERAGDIAGWEVTIRESAAGYAAWAADRPSVGSHLGAANMYRLVGEELSAREHADAAIPLIHVSDDDAGFDPSVGSRLAAEILAGRRASMRDLARQHGEVRTGSRWWTICSAASAAEAGDAESLRRLVHAAERRASDEPVAWCGGEPSDRDLAEILWTWLEAAPEAREHA